MDGMAKYFIIGGIILMIPSIVALSMLAFIFLSAGSSDEEIGGGGDMGGMYEATSLPPEVLRWAPTVRKIARELEMTQYIDVVLAMIAQESGGTIIPDVMQSSEAKCGTVADEGCLYTPEDSIRAGMTAFKARLQEVDPELLKQPYSNIQDGENKLRIAVQSYNYGPGFPPFARVGSSYKKLTLSLTEAFSALQTERLGWGCSNWQTPPHCYGDTEYVERVWKYLARAIGGDGSALGETTFRKLLSIMNQYVPGRMTYNMVGSFDPTPGSGYFDCSSFVMYVFRQIGVNLPRTAAEQFHATQEIPAGSEKPGDLVVFYGTYMNGISHIGIVIDPATSTMLHCGSSSCVAKADYNAGYWDDYAARYGKASEYPRFSRVTNLMGGGKQ